MSLSMEEIRDAVVAFSDEHERDCPGDGRPCRNNRAAMIGYLAHCLGIRAPDQWERVREVAEDYDARCEGLNCRHEPNGRTQNVDELPVIGTVQIVDIETGQVKEEKPGMRLLPPAPGLCPECAVQHKPELPHSKDSLYYQMHFYAKHRRYPTYTDAMAHCTAETKALWREHIITILRQIGEPIPDDLSYPSTP